MGLEPTIYRLEVCRASIAPLEHIHRVGFEPTKHNAADLKSAPFDQTPYRCKRSYRDLNSD